MRSRAAVGLSQSPIIGTVKEHTLSRDNDLDCAVGGLVHGKDSIFANKNGVYVAICIKTKTKTKTKVKCTG